VADELNLSNLKPAQPRKERKRVGRGLGSGKGRYSGRGIKGQKARSGSHKMPAGFEGGQMPIDMRLPKLRGNTSADAMPIGPFRTYSQPVNVRDLEARFDAGAEITPDTLKAARLIRTTRTDVKILGVGELTKKLSVSAHGFSKSAVEKIEAAGGSITWLRGEPEPKKAKKAKKTKPPATEAPVAEELAVAAPVGSGEAASAVVEPGTASPPKASAAKAAAVGKVDVVGSAGDVRDLDWAPEPAREALVAAGVRSVEEFLAAGATPSDRDALAVRLGVEQSELLTWLNRADLMRIKGVGPEFAVLLEAAGVDTVPELAQRNAANLAAALVELNAAEKLTKRAPSEGQVAGWVEQAGSLDRVLQYG